MSGIPKFNIPAFDAAAAELRRRGFDVVSPAEVDGPISREVLLRSESGSHDDLPQDESWSYYLSRDFRILADEGIELIVHLPGWEESRGARLETVVGKELGIPSMTFEALINFQDFAAEHPAPYAFERATDTEAELPSVMETNAEPELYDAEGEFIKFRDSPERQRSVTGGVKDNRSKEPIDLIPWKPLLGAAAVLAFGAKKYKPHNWRLGLSWTQTWSSLQRHLWKWLDGEDIDPETRLPHIDHALCQLLFLSEYVHSGTGEDDRFVSIDREGARA